METPTSTSELKERINMRRHEMMAKLLELKADTRHEASALHSKLTAELAELEQDIKDGWDTLTDNVREKLNQWLTRN